MQKMKPERMVEAIIMMTFTHSFEDEPTEAQIQEWCDTFPEYSKKIREHAEMARSQKEISQEDMCSDAELEDFLGTVREIVNKTQ